MTAAEHLEAAERALSLGEQYLSEGKYDRAAALAALATAHILMSLAKDMGR